MHRSTRWLPLVCALAVATIVTPVLAEKPAAVAPAAPLRVAVGTELVISARGVRSYSVQQADHLVELTADAEHFTFTGRVPGKVQLVTIGADGVSKSVVIDVVPAPPGAKVAPFASARGDVADPFGAPIDPSTSSRQPKQPVIPKTAAARKALLARLRNGSATAEETLVLRAACKQAHDEACVAWTEIALQRREKRPNDLGY